jgi:predicted  nucleic acid-binding Zn-ribbon protein
VMQVYDASLQAQNERQALANRLDQNGASLCEKIEQASHWNCEAQDRLNCQTATLGNLVPRIQAWSPELRKSALVEEDRRQARETLDSLRRDLEALQARAGEQDLGGLAKGVKDLVARGGKLALRLAAETARAKEGEGSLLVVAEELQDLTTEFRAVATRMDDQSDYQKTIVQAVACIFDKISEFEAAAVAGEMPAADAWRELSQQVDEAQQEMQQTLAAMTDLPEGFNRQLEQLAEVGKKWAELTGAKFAPNQPKRSTTLARERPLSSTLRVQATRSASPPAGNVELDPAQAPAFEVETSKPARPSIFGTNESKPKPPEMLRPLPQPEDFDLAPANVKSQGGNPPLSSAEDRVYDLAEFGAVALSEGTPVDGTADDRIYDLTEFGAVALS